jgi:acetyl-CoA C-acetyltransferase
MSGLAELAVIGVGQTPYRRQYDVSTAELVQQAASQALTNAEVELRDIDMVIAGFAPDGLAGEASPEKRFLPAAGAVGKWSMRINSGGTTGIAAAFAAMDLLEAGHGDLALVLGVERMAQSKNVPAVFNSIFDPIYERDASLSTLSMCAMRASRMMQKWGYTREQFAKIAARNFLHASQNQYSHIRRPYSERDVLDSRLLSWPIRQLDACPVSEGVCAIVVARTSALDGRAPVAHVRGRATRTDTYSQGDRLGRPEGDLVDMLALRLATAVAFDQAGIRSAHDSDVIEIHAPFDSAEAMAYAPLRLCSPEDGPALVASNFGGRQDQTVINPSGGPQASNPVGATALVRLAECAIQVMGTAGDHQVPGAATAIATGQGGSTQFSTCTVLASS